MLIDFQPVIKKELPMIEFARRFTLDELRVALASYVEATRQIVEAASDEQLFRIPEDPEADDPYTENEAERYVGWSLAHLVLHVTASAEEGAAFSSMLARGVAVSERLRYEPDWRTLTGRSAVLARLAECQRMCTAYLDTWPDEPHLETLRVLPEKWKDVRINAPAAFLGGLSHWSRHITQMQRCLTGIDGPVGLDGSQ